MNDASANALYVSWPKLAGLLEDLWSYRVINDALLLLLQHIK